MTQEFNPQDWINKNQSSDITKAVDKVVTRIEAAFTDITTNYSDWINVGFAFAHEFGESGRSFFQRISRYYNGFTLTECNKQYDQCLKSKKGGITIRTFFHLAKQAGIDVSTVGSDQFAVGSDQFTVGSDQWSVGSPSSPRPLTPSSSHPLVPSSPHPLVPSSPRPLSPYEEPEPDDEESPEEELPPFPDEIFGKLPTLLKRVVEMASSRPERDILLLGSLGTFSAVLPRVYGIYDGNRVEANIFVFITAQASAGKGRLVLCKHLVNRIHWRLRDETYLSRTKYDGEMREFNLIKGKDFSAEKPEKPPEKLLFIPANCSATGVFQLLSDNGGHGLIFETEGDTMAQAFKSDFGNYSDGFRKAFHHETINYYRRTDREYVEIPDTYLSAVLSGTKGQIVSLIPSAENGLSSRFAFYMMGIKAVWKDVFADGNNNNLKEHFLNIGKDFFDFHTLLKDSYDIQFCFTAQQHLEFNEFFTHLLDKYMVLQGTDYIGTIRRLGLIAFRIAMILSTLRIPETGVFQDKMVCSEDDFQTTLSMIRILVKHASRVFSELPGEVKNPKKANKKEQFLDKLPEKFGRKEYLEIAKTLLIADRTADMHIAAFCKKGMIMRDDFNSYTKTDDR